MYTLLLIVLLEHPISHWNNTRWKIELKFFMHTDRFAHNVLSIPKYRVKVYFIRYFRTKIASLDYLNHNFTTIDTIFFFLNYFLNCVGSRCSVPSVHIVSTWAYNIIVSRTRFTSVTHLFTADCTTIAVKYFAGRMCIYVNTFITDVIIIQCYLFINVYTCKSYYICMYVCVLIN